MVLTPEQIRDIREELSSLPPGEQEKRAQEIIAHLSPEELEQLQGGDQSECPFCLMAQGKIPVKTVYEDEKCQAILDINPANNGHVLLFPKKHAQLLTQLEDKDVGHLFKVAKNICTAFESLGAKGSNIYVANGGVAGQRAPHTLVNIIPRFENDELHFGWKPKKISEKEMDESFEKLKEAAKKIRINEEVEVVKKHEQKVSVEEFGTRLP